MPRANWDIENIAAGYATGVNIVYELNTFNGQPSTGDITLSGTSFTPHDGSSTSLGAINHGIDIASSTGTGYVMFSATSVHDRFDGADEPNPNNSDHLIAVRHNGNDWQYSDGTAWHNFTSVSTDLLLAEIDFGTTTVYDLGGYLPWADFLHERALAEQTAWNNLTFDYNTWQGAIRGAYHDYAYGRADEYYDSAKTLANGARTFSYNVADEVREHVERASEDESQFQKRLADAVAKYRSAIAKAEYRYARDYAKAVRDNDSAAQQAAIDALADDKADAEADYKDRYADIDRW
ncbi:MAG: hypothetical protein MI923_17255, partial [Phycisphaerales bacterium]|nr:hypothetical protein [Phycisphaerales bacterium]